MKKLPFIRQRDASECGTTCLAMVYRYYGLTNIQSNLRDMAEVSVAGVNLYMLKRTAEKFGFDAEGYKIEYDHLEEITTPCIAHYEGNHFVVIYKAGPRAVYIADPAYGKTRISREQFQGKWNGVILTLEPTEKLFQSEEVKSLLKEQIKRKNFIKNFYISVFKPFRRRFAEVAAASGILQLMGAFLPFFTSTLLDKVIGEKHYELLYAILLGLLGISLLQIILGFVRSMFLAGFKVQFELEFFSKLFNHLIHLSQKYFDSHKKEDFINRFQENLKIRSLFSSSILQSFIDLLFLVNFIIIMFLYNYRLAVTALIFISVTVLLTIIFTPHLRHLENKIFHSNEKAMGSFLDTLLGIQTVKLRVIEKLKLSGWRRKYTRALAEELRTEKTYMLLNSLMGAVNIVSQGAIYWLGVLFIFNGTMTVGQYVAFITIFSIVISSIQSISGLWFMLLEVSVTYEKLNDIFTQAPEIDGYAEIEPDVKSPDIKITGLSFKYNSSSEQNILEDINLEIPYGERIGIVGRNGSGKTTLVKLLAGMYKNYTGRINIDDRPLAGYHPHRLRKTMYLMPQNVYLFGGTIKDNIICARPGAPDEDILEASKLAGLHEFVSELYLGYNHKTGNSGDNLSSGQKLKIAFARLFLADPEVIMLDEASSVLDPESEKRIFENIYSHFRGRTILIIAHRFQTLKAVDRIVALDKGRLVESGSHGELLEKKGMYYTLMKNYLEF